MFDLEAELQKLCASGEASGPIDNLTINQAEMQLDVKFPSQYRQILKKHGAFVANGVELYGILTDKNDEPSVWIDIVEETKKLKEWEQAGTEREGFIPFSDDGCGVYFFFDTMVSPSTKIHAIGPGIDKFVSDNLYDFIIKSSRNEFFL